MSHSPDRKDVPPASPQWTAEIDVDLPLARRLLAHRLPELVVRDIELFGVGWDNTAFLVNGELVARFPRRAVAAPLLEREIRILPRLAPALPLAVPVPIVVGPPDDAFPWWLAGYSMLSGTTACRARLTRSRRASLAKLLGAFLRSLHSFPTAEARALGVGEDEIGRLDLRKRVPKAQQEIAALSERGALEDSLAKRLLGAIEDASRHARSSSEVLLHGDLYARHLLVDANGAPTGVIDWGDVHIGHPATDLAIAAGFLPRESRADFTAAYGSIDDATWALSTFRAISHAVAVLPYALTTGDEALLHAMMETLRGAVDS